MQSIVVTGVSTGIGPAIVRVLAARGFHVFGSVRKLADAQPLVDELGDKFTALVFDITDEAAVRAAVPQVAAKLGKGRLFGLVNNAGVALPAPLLTQPIEEFRRQITINLIGPMIVTQAFLPLLGTDPAREGARGRVVNMSSVGGKMGAPMLGGYVASKHGLEGWSETLRRELMLFGIDVVVVAPGSVNTPIWDKAQLADTQAHPQYAEIFAKVVRYFVRIGPRGYAPEVVGEAVHTALTTPKPEVRYALVPKSFTNWTIPMLLPKRVVDRAMAKQFGIEPR